MKICGLRDETALEAAIAARADMVGFVFFERSPRHLSLAAAATLAAAVDGRTSKVTLTVDADDASLAAVIEAAEPDLLQLHGHETPERVRAIRARFGLPVMKAVAIAEAGDLQGLAAFDRVADYLLLDAKTPAELGRPGGAGVAFDWTLLRGLETRCPWLLAGGLHEGNVGDALRISGARGVDVSSGVETSHGVKDGGRIGAFVSAARAAAE